MKIKKKTNKRYYQKINFNKLIRPITLIKIFLKKKKYIKLDLPQLTHGHHRELYKHPFDNTKCIKIIKKKESKFFNQNIEEYEVFNFRKYYFTSNLHTIVKTNKGLGFVYDLIYDYNFNISKTLNTFIYEIVKKQHNNYQKEFIKNLKNFLNLYINKNKGLVRGILRNCCVKVNDKNYLSYNFIIIDNFINQDFKIYVKYKNIVISYFINKIIRKINNPEINEELYDKKFDFILKKIKL